MRIIYIMRARFGVPAIAAVLLMAFISPLISGAEVSRPLAVGFKIGIFLIGFVPSYWIWRALLGRVSCLIVMRGSPRRSYTRGSRATGSRTSESSTSP